MPYNPLQWPHLREWRMVKFFWTLCSLPAIPRPWMLGAIPHRLKGSDNPDVSHSTEGVCKRLSTRHTSVVMKFRAFENSRKPDSWIVHLGDNAAHRSILTKRTEAPTPTDDMRTRGSDDLPCLKQQHCFCGMWKDRVLPLTIVTQKHPHS